MIHMNIAISRLLNQTKCLKKMYILDQGRVKLLQWIAPSHYNEYGNVIANPSSLTVRNELIFLKVKVQCGVLYVK